MRKRHRINIGELLIFGRVAGENIVREKAV
jgi:hypothetical protein